MNPKLSFRFLLSIIVLLLASLACNAVTNFFDEDPVSHTPKEPVPVVPSIEDEPEPDPATEPLLCLAVTDRILSVATEFYEEDSDSYDGEEPEQIYLVTYDVSEDQIGDPYFEEVSANLTGFQDDAVSHQEIWDYFITLVPAGERSSLAEYSIVTDGEGNLLAAVAQTTYDPALWGLEVDIRDSGDRLNLTYTLIHEYAHLLTLGPDQVSPSVAVFNNPSVRERTSRCDIDFADVYGVQDPTTQQWKPITIYVSVTAVGAKTFGKLNGLFFASLMQIGRAHV